MNTYGVHIIRNDNTSDRIWVSALTKADAIARCHMQPNVAAVVSAHKATDILSSWFHVEVQNTQTGSLEWHATPLHEAAMAGNLILGEGHKPTGRALFDRQESIAETEETLKRHRDPGTSWIQFRIGLFFYMRQVRKLRMHNEDGSPRKSDYARYRGPIIGA
jgi:hypothetical protein